MRAASRWLLTTPILLAAAGCAPAHMRSVGLSGGGREMGELFLGGWDGRRLIAFDETAVEPGATRRADVARLVGSLSSGQYAAVYVEKERLDATAAAHALFCDAPLCLAVFDRKGAGEFSGWGEAVAVFELKGPDGPVGNVWIAARGVRAPGPRKWDLRCRSKQEPPRYVHPDGGALFPARPEGAEGFALFGATDTGAYKREGFAAPAPTTCDEEKLRSGPELENERPSLQVDPGLLKPPSAEPPEPPPSKPTKGGGKGSGKRKP